MSNEINFILNLFHHIHHDGEIHKVHHCGGKHVEINHKLNYNIEHCSCGKHKIDKITVLGHDFDMNEVKVVFRENCPEGGWHIESGEKKNYSTIDRILLTIYGHKIKNPKKPLT